MALSIKKRNLSLEAQYRVKIHIPKALSSMLGEMKERGPGGGGAVEMGPILKKKSLLILMHPFNI